MRQPSHRTLSHIVTHRRTLMMPTKLICSRLRLHRRPWPLFWATGAPTNTWKRIKADTHTTMWIYSLDSRSFDTQPIYCKSHLLHFCSMYVLCMFYVFDCICSGVLHLTALVSAAPCYAVPCCALFEEPSKWSSTSGDSGSATSELDPGIAEAQQVNKKKREECWKMLEDVGRLQNGERCWKKSLKSMKIHGIMCLGLKNCWLNQKQTWRIKHPVKSTNFHKLVAASELAWFPLRLQSHVAGASAYSNQAN